MLSCARDAAVAEVAKGVRLASITTVISARASRVVSLIFVAPFLKFKS
jgi:hypothetical protein